MSMLSLHHGDHGVQHDTSPLHSVRAFAADWLEATPAAILLRPVGIFLMEWAKATPIAVLARALHH